MSSNDGMDRRTAAAFIAGVGLGAATIRLGSFRPGAFAAQLFESTAGVRRLAALGVQPPASLPSHGQESGTSVLTVLDLARGIATPYPLAFPEAHALVELGPAGYAVVGNHRYMALLDPDFRLRQLLTAPKGREFGGHGVWLGAGQPLIVTLRTDRRAEVSLPGRLAALDPHSGEVLQELDSGGYEPHDLTLLADGRLAVANYGNRRRADLAAYTAFEASLSFFSIPDLALVHRIAGPRLGALSHLQEGPRGTLGLLPASMTQLNDDHLKGLAQALGGVPPVVSVPEILEQKLGGPAAILTLDLAQESWSSHLVDPQKQRRAQSIVYHPKVQAWFVTYPFSEYVARLGVDGTVKLCPAFDLGLSYVRGVCVDPYANAVYVSGQFRGIVRLNASTLAVEARFDTLLHDTVHLYVLPIA